MTFDELLAEAGAQLRLAGIATSGLDARVLLEHCSGLSRTALLLRGNSPVDAALSGPYLALVQQRATRVPLAYLTGFKEFWSLNFHVGPAVLVPRPETEFLLEQVLLTCRKNSIRPERALDLCTGSGVIAIVLALELGCPVLATDISAQALDVAAMNCREHGVEHLVTLRLGDLFAPLAGWKTKKVDLLVSNPPYIADAEINGLEPEVSLAEPRLALSGGASGCDVLARIAREIPAFLRPGGFLFLEIGADQGPVALALFSAPVYEGALVLPDWSGRARVLRARLAQTDVGQRV